jgi:hypothetical protein
MEPISMTMTGFALLVIVYYLLKGYADSRWRILLIVLSAAALPFLTIWATRGWELLGNALALATSLMHSIGQATA